MNNNIDEIIRKTTSEILEKFIRKKMIKESTLTSTITTYTQEINDGLWGYVEITSDELGLPLTIFVDVNASYKYYKHQPCLYVPNSYMDYSELIPISIEENPDLLNDVDSLNIYRSDLYQIFTFVSNNYRALLMLASEKLDYSDFYKRIKLLGESKRLLVEMPIIQRKRTGLPLEIWIDKGNHQDQCEHGARIKFRSSDNPNPNTWASITLPNMDIPQTHEINVPQRAVNMVVEFVRLNFDNLMRLVNKEISYETFLSLMVTFDNHGNPVYPTNEPSYIPFKNADYGFTIVKNNNNKFNYINNDTQKLLVNNSNGEPLWLDSANVFKKYKNGIICAYVEYDFKGYYLYLNGCMKEV